MAWPAKEEREERTQRRRRWLVAALGRVGGFDATFAFDGRGTDPKDCGVRRSGQIGQEVDDVDVVVPVHVIKGKIALATSSGAARRNNRTSEFQKVTRLPLRLRPQSVLKNC